MKYIVLVREVHISHVLINAASEEEAITLVKDAEGEEVYSEYSHTLDPNTWTIENENEN